jgi:hypothetical protein
MIPADHNMIVRLIVRRILHLARHAGRSRLLLPAQPACDIVYTKMEDS